MTVLEMIGLPVAFAVSSSQTIVQTGCSIELKTVIKSTVKIYGLLQLDRTTRLPLDYLCNVFQL